MDKNILKKFAIESRQELMEKMRNKINTFYINEEFNKEQRGDLYILSNDKHSLTLSKEEYDKRESLINRIKELTLEQVIEEAAYTWFNRIIAIRYMEIHDYLPLTKDNQSLGFRVLSSKDNTPDPEILKFTNLSNSELDIDFKKEKYAELKDDNEKFKYILLLVCKKLGRVIPQVFDGITDYIDILIPDNLLNDSGFVTKVISDIPEECYREVEIIGWLYQFYIQLEKERVMSLNTAYTRRDIPYVTQLFTPDWIVKYMVENTLGRFYLEHSDSALADFKWNYFANDEIEKKDRISINEISFIDPCCGSGHILTYAFEILYEIYIKEGYNKNDIAELILRNNLNGIDIDDRACQLSILSVFLKAREYDKNIFNKGIVSNSNIISIKDFSNVDDRGDINNDNISLLKKYFINAKEIGSLLKLEKKNFDELKSTVENDVSIFGIENRKRLLPLIKQYELLQKKYSIMVTNPPYLKASLMSNSLKEYLKNNYTDSKADLFACFTERAMELTQREGYYALITPPSILFLGAFEKVRNNILSQNTIVSLLHMGRGVFGVDFGSTSFVIKNSRENKMGWYFRMVDRTFQMILIEDYEELFLRTKNDREIKINFKKYEYGKIENTIDLNGRNIFFEKNQNDFINIPKTPIAYWISDKMLKLFSTNKSIGNNTRVVTGMTTADNERFLRFWYEVNSNKINFNGKLGNGKWIPYQKGGDYRKWYGNNLLVVNWENDGYEIKHNIDENGKVRSGSYNEDFIYKEGITWSYISSAGFGVRYVPPIFHFDNKGSMIFTNDEDLIKMMAYLNSYLVKNILDLYNPTMSFQPGDIMKIPFEKEVLKNDELQINAMECIDIMKNEWNSNEYSFDFIFKFHSNSTKLKEIVDGEIDFWKNEKNNLYTRERIIDSIVLKHFDVYDEYKNELEEIEPVLEIPSQKDIIKKVISYYVGCLFGRYSLNKEGLIFAGGDFDKNIYDTFMPDEDNIIPITDDAYFRDDIVARFKQFIEVAFSKDTLNENIDFIAETLGKKGTETSENTIRRYFLNDFFNDHVKMYQKRPIYWLFDSGKKNGFKALIYMHRYNENLIPKVRLDYLHKIQTTYEKLLIDINDRLKQDLSTQEKRQAQAKQADLNAKLNEIKEYDEKIAHIANMKKEDLKIDLDDGVRENYKKFRDILANSKEIIGKEKDN